MEKESFPCAEHQYRLGRLEAQVEALFNAVGRIESKLDVNIAQHDERLRDVEGEIKAIRRIGTIVAVLWTTFTAVIVWLFRPVS